MLGQRCQSCGKPIKGKPRSSPMYSRVCASCHDKTFGMAMGLLNNSPGQMAAGPGIVKWIRTSLGR